jgi:hypothetical protein
LVSLDLHPHPTALRLDCGTLNAATLLYPHLYLLDLCTDHTDFSIDLTQPGAYLRLCTQFETPTRRLPSRPRVSLVLVDHRSLLPAERHLHAGRLCARESLLALLGVTLAAFAPVELSRAPELQIP